MEDLPGWVLTAGGPAGVSCFSGGVDNAAEVAGLLLRNEKPPAAIGRTPPPETKGGVVPPVVGPTPNALFLDAETVVAPREKEPLEGWPVPPVPNTKPGVGVGAAPPIPANADRTGAAGLA